jgi:hypothetical protein
MTRKLLFTAVLLAWALAGIEIVSTVLLRLSSGDPEKILALALGEPKAEGASPARSGEPGEEVLHPYLGYSVAPAPGVATGDLTMEALGFADGGPLVRQRQPDAVVLAVFGGSAAHLFSVWDGPARIFEALQVLPEFRGRRLVVVNAAQDGFKQPQSLLSLVYLLSLGALFDLVILIDGFNEVALPPVHNVSQGVFPFYPADWALRVARLEVAPRTRSLIGEVSVLQSLRRESAASLEASPLRHSSTAFLAWILWDRALSGRLSSARSELLSRAPQDEFDYAVTGPRWSAGEGAVAYPHLVEIWKRSSFQMNALCESNGIRFHHVLQPYQYVPGSKPFAPGERQIALRRNNPYRPHVEGGYPLLRTAGRELREAGVRFHDLTQVFAETSDPVYVDDSVTGAAAARSCSGSPSATPSSQTNVQNEIEHRRL